MISIGLLKLCFRPQVMEGIAKHPFDDIMDLPKDTAYPAIEDIPWPDLNLECNGLLNSEVGLSYIETPGMSPLKNQHESRDLHPLSNNGEGTQFSPNEVSSISRVENKADYHSFCADIDSIVNSEDGLVASVMLGCPESNTEKSKPRVENSDENSARRSTFDEHLIANNPTCSPQTCPSIQADKIPMNPDPVANMALPPHYSSSTPPSPLARPLMSRKDDDIQGDALMLQIEDITGPTTSHDFLSKLQPPAFEKQDVGGASIFNSVKATTLQTSLPLLPLPSVTSSTIAPSAAPSSPSSSQNNDKRITDANNVNTFSTTTEIDVSRNAALSSIFLQHEVPQSLFKGYLLARFPLNLAHKLETTRQGRVQKRTIMIAKTKSGFSLGGNNSEVTEAARVKLTPSKLRSDGANSAGHSLEVVIEPKHKESSTRSIEVAASEGGQLLRIPSRQERMAQQRAPVPKHPMKIKCPMCKLMYKHKGTLMRHLITKHEYYDDIDIIPLHTSLDAYA